MQCAEIVSAGQPLRVVSRPLPTAPPKGVLVRTACSGICHTDLHYIDDEADLGNGKIFRHRDILGDKFTGVVVGHEISGTVVALGEEVERSVGGIQVGDRVLVYPWTGCLVCTSCKADMGNLCDAAEWQVADISKGRRDGGHATHVQVPEVRFVIRVPDTLSTEVACMLPCSALTAYSALIQAQESLEEASRMYKRNPRLLIIGAGGLGLWCVQMTKMLNSSINITVADVQADKLATATDMGADHVVQWDPQQTEAQLISMTLSTAGLGKEKDIDSVIDFVGRPSTLQVGFNVIRKGGTLVPVGLYGGALNIPVPTLITRSIKIKGNRTGTLVKLRDLVALLAVNPVKPPPIEFFNLADINEAMDKLRAGKIPGRAIIQF